MFKLNLDGQGKRKLNLVYYFGTLGFISFLFTTKEITYVTALFGLWVALCGWYNQSNIKEHDIEERSSK